MLIIYGTIYIYIYTYLAASMTINTDETTTATTTIDRPSLTSKSRCACYQIWCAASNTFFTPQHIDKGQEQHQQAPVRCPLMIRHHHHHLTIVLCNLMCATNMPPTARDLFKCFSAHLDLYTSPLCASPFD